MVVSRVLVKNLLVPDAQLLVEQQHLPFVREMGQLLLNSKVGRIDPMRLERDGTDGRGLARRITVVYVLNRIELLTDVPIRATLLHSLILVLAHCVVGRKLFLADLATEQWCLFLQFDDGPSPHCVVTDADGIAPVAGFLVTRPHIDDRTVPGPDQSRPRQRSFLGAQPVFVAD